MEPDLLAYGAQLLATLEEPGGLPGRIKVRPVRSALYVPADRQDWLRKCERFGADAIIADMEDAVLPENRDKARGVLAEEVTALAQRVRNVWVRVNAEAEEMPRDLDAAVRSGLATIQLPKVGAPEQVVELDRRLDALEKERGLAPGRIAICPILETAQGLHHSYEIALCSRRVEYLGALVSPFGDTARALGLKPAGDAMHSESLYLRSKVLLDARAAGIRYPLGGVVTDLAPDQATLKAFATANRSLGYTGILVIHPAHAATANAIYSPPPEEIRLARETLAAFRASGGRGVIRGPGGEMVDRAQARFAALLLLEAKELGLPMEAP